MLNCGSVGRKDLLTIVCATLFTGVGLAGSSATAGPALGDRSAATGISRPGPCITRGAGITPSVLPSRTSGVAPLAVFFDATATTAAATSQPYHELEYQWSFGDTDAGNWGFGSRAGISSKNEATGPMAAHVFEKPGTYNVCMAATDGTNTAHVVVPITVEDPDVVFSGSTLCVSASGSFTGCPSGATRITNSDFSNVIDKVAARGARFKRILFERGQTFTSSRGSVISAEGPGYLGAWGVGAKPIIAGPTDKLVLGNNLNYSFGDWRIVELNFDGVNRAPGKKGVFGGGPAGRITILNCVFRNLDIGIELEILMLDFINKTSKLAPIWSQWAVVGNVFRDNSNYGVLGSITDSAFLGNQIIGQLSQHGFRLSYHNKVVISNNEITGTPSGVALTMRGAAWELADRGSGNQYTLPAHSYSENSIVSDNKIISGAGTFTFMGSNPTDRPRFRNHIVERNWIISGTGPGAALSTVAGLSTIRNNLIERNGTADLRTIEIVSPQDPEIRKFYVYNNSVYSGAVTSSVPFSIANTNIGPVDLVVRNNLGIAPGNTNGQTAPVLDFVRRGYTASGNSTVGQIKGASPLTTTPPTRPWHWRPRAGSYPINNGTSVPVFSDFFAVPRTGNHMGAVNP